MWMLPNTKNLNRRIRILFKNLSFPNYAYSISQKWSCQKPSWGCDRISSSSLISQWLWLTFWKFYSNSQINTLILKVKPYKRLCLKGLYWGQSKLILHFTMSLNKPKTYSISQKWSCQSPRWGCDRISSSGLIGQRNGGWPFRKLTDRFRKSLWGKWKLFPWVNIHSNLK